MATQQIQPGIKMFASFNRGIYIPMVGPNESPESVYAFLKERNARISLDRVRDLIEGRETMFRDFEVVTVQGHHGVPQTLSIPAASRVAAEDPNRPAPVVHRTPVPTGQQAANLVSGSPQVARGRGREYAPTGQIKALKRGTVYAQLMEMLLHGATMKELLAATSNVTAGGVNDVLSWQIKNRGYGLRFDAATGKYWLVLPKGHTSLTYKD